MDRLDEINARIKEIENEKYSLYIEARKIKDSLSKHYVMVKAVDYYGTGEVRKWYEYAGFKTEESAMYDARDTLRDLTEEVEGFGEPVVSYAEIDDDLVEKVTALSKLCRARDEFSEVFDTTLRVVSERFLKAREDLLSCINSEIDTIADELKGLKWVEA